ncbi:Potassium efflux system KefA protein [Salmonella bongori]|nr:Potassium efflux system KefA protein [Salmonella bongori]
MLLLNAWGLFDFWHWLHYGAGEKMVDILIRIALILFFSAVGWTILASLIENRLASDIHGRPLPSARTRTLLTLFRNALAVIISTITIMIVLSEIGVNIAPLLAGAGALGLAISFGSQTLVKDIITGVFIQFENGMNTGRFSYHRSADGDGRKNVDSLCWRKAGYRGISYYSVVFDHHFRQFCAGYRFRCPLITTWIAMKMRIKRIRH